MWLSALPLSPLSSSYIISRHMYTHIPFMMHAKRNVTKRILWIFMKVRERWLLPELNSNVLLIYFHSRFVVLATVVVVFIFFFIKNILTDSSNVITTFRSILTCKRFSKISSVHRLTRCGVLYTHSILHRVMYINCSGMHEYLHEHSHERCKDELISSHQINNLLTGNHLTEVIRTGKWKLKAKNR